MGIGDLSGSELGEAQSHAINQLQLIGTANSGADVIAQSAEVIAGNRALVDSQSSAAQQATTDFLDAANSSYATTLNNANGALTSAIDQAASTLVATGAEDTAGFTFGALTWPDAPALTGIPTVSWSGSTPEVAALNLNGPSYDVNLFDQAGIDSDTANASATNSNRTSEISNADNESVAQAASTYDVGSANAYTLYQTERDTAQDQYDRVTGQASSGLASLRTLVVNAEATNVTELAATQLAYTTATGLAHVQYNSAVSSANAIHSAAIQSAHEAYSAAVQAAAEARDAEIAAAADELNEGWGSGSGSGSSYGSGSSSSGSGSSGSGSYGSGSYGSGSYGSGSYGSGSYGSGSYYDAGSGSGSSGIGDAAYDRYEARVAAAHAAYKAAEASAAQLRADTITDADKVRTESIADATKVKENALSDAEKNRTTAVDEANKKLADVRLSTTADESDIQSTAGVALQRANGLAQAKYDRSIADLTRNKADQLASAEKTRDIAEAAAAAYHAKELILIKQSHFVGSSEPALADWASYQQALLNHEVTRVVTIEDAAVTLVTASCDCFGQCGHCIECESAFSAFCLGDRSWQRGFGS